MYSKLNKILNNKILILIILLFLPIIIELLVSNQIIIDKSSICRFLFIYGVYFLIGIFYVLKKQSNLISQILDFIIKHRYIISIIVFLVLFLLRINFSSIDIWCNIIGESENKSTLIGNPKTIRSDEW